MGIKKVGRPTDSPKDIVLKVRIDQVTSDRLETCCGKLAVSKAEIVRRGVKKMYDDLEK